MSAGRQLRMWRALALTGSEQRGASFVSEAGRSPFSAIPFSPNNSKKERVLTVDDYIIKGARTQRTTGLLSYELPLRFLNLNPRGESRNKGL